MLCPAGQNGYRKPRRPGILAPFRARDARIGRGRLTMTEQGPGHLARRRPRTPRRGLTLCRRRLGPPPRGARHSRRSTCAATRARVAAGRPVRGTFRRPSGDEGFAWPGHVLTPGELLLTRLRLGEYGDWYGASVPIVPGTGTSVLIVPGTGAPVHPSSEDRIVHHDDRPPNLTTNVVLSGRPVRDSNHHALARLALTLQRGCVIAAAPVLSTNTRCEDSIRRRSRRDSRRVLSDTG